MRSSLRKDNRFFGLVGVAELDDEACAVGVMVGGKGWDSVEDDMITAVLLFDTLKATNPWKRDKEQYGGWSDEKGARQQELSPEERARRER